MQSISYFLIPIVFFILLIPSSFAVIPLEQFVFQGVLKEDSGALVTDTKDFTLRLYTEGSGTIPANNCDSSSVCLWQENQTNIGVSNGLFTINAGNTTSFSNLVNFTNALYLEVIVKDTGSSNDEVLSPRLSVGATPFSFSTSRASLDFDLNKKEIVNGTGVNLIGGDYIHNATVPVHVGSIIDTGATILDAPHGIDVVGNYAYVVGNVDNGVEIIDISVPSNPVSVGSISGQGSPNFLDSALDIFVSGNYAYVTAQIDNAVTILDISDPSNPTHVSSIVDDVSTILAQPHGIFVSGNHAYVTSLSEDGVQIIDISNPTNPIPLGSITDDGTTALDNPRTIRVSGNYAYVVGGNDDGVEIIDISDPGNPTHVGAIFDDGTTALDGPVDIFIAGRYAYVTAFADDGVEILDISDPGNPTHVGAIFDDATIQLHSPTNIMVSGYYAYVTTSNNIFDPDAETDSLHIIDISDPTNPTHIAELLDDGSFPFTALSHFDIIGNHIVYSAQTDDAVGILRISGMTAPAASIGNIQTDSLHVTNDAIISNGLYSGSLNIGFRGIHSSGDIVSSGNLTTNSFLNLNPTTELTIASGTITATKSFHTVDTQSNAATDDLTTINGGTVGKMLIITAEDDARDVIVRDDSGNIALIGDFTMDNSQDKLAMIFDGTNWLELFRADNGP